MKYRVVITGLAALVYGNQNASKETLRWRARQRLGTFSKPSSQNPVYLGRRTWRVPVDDVKIGLVEADFPEEAIKKTCDATGLSPDSLRVVISE